MKVGVVVDNELNNDKRVLREAAILQEAGHEVFFLCFGFRRAYKNPLAKAVVRRIRISKTVKNILFFFQNTIPVYEWFWSNAVRNFILESDCDLVHTHDLYMSRAVHKGIIKSGKKIPLILDLHEYYPYSVAEQNWTKGFLRNFLSRPYFWLKKEKEYLDYADGIIVLSDEFRDTLTSKYPELEKKKFISFPNVPDPGYLLQKADKVPELPFEKDAFILFYFGIVAERRGIFELLEVFESLCREKMNLALLIVGPVDKKDRVKFESKVSEPFLKSRTLWIPWIDLSELPGYLSVIDAGVAPFKINPQHESGVANKIYDYMSGKKPLIVSSCRPQKNLVEKHNCGIAYSSTEEMKKAIKQLAADPDLCIKMGENGLQAILTEYNTGITKGKLLELYNRML